MWFFRSPTVVFGEDAVLHIRDLRGKRAFVVSDKTLSQKGHLAPVLFQLEHAGMQVKTFLDVEPEPALTTVETGADLCEDFGPDWIVAVGGGSRRSGNSGHLAGGFSRDKLPQRHKQVIFQRHNAVLRR